MPSPFPGMDPYLEAPWRWPDLHHRLITQISDVLTAQLSGGAQQLMVDVSGLSFADSASVRALVLAGKALREWGGTLVIARPQRAVARLLELMGVDELFVVQGGAAGQARIKDSGTRESGEGRRPPGGPS